jgi:hypothetical protein
LAHPTSPIPFSFCVCVCVSLSLSFLLTSWLFEGWEQTFQNSNTL